MATATDRTPTYITKINETYFEFADHYGCGVNPARRGRPTDKNIVESAVHLVEQWIIASLDEDVFYTLEEYNAEVRRKIDWLNDRHFQQKDGSRRSVFEEEERGTLKKLPLNPYEIVSWEKATVAPNSRVRIEYMQYSCPYAYVGKRLDIRKTATKVDILADGITVASHKRVYGKKAQYSTVKDHMPSTWGTVDNPWSSERFERWADGVGPKTRMAIDRVLASRVIVEQAFTPCQNILGPAKQYGRKMLEAACADICMDSHAIPTYTLVKTKVVELRREDAERVSVLVGQTPADKMRGKGRTRGADYYRIEGGR